MSSSRSSLRSPSPRRPAPAPARRQRGHRAARAVHHQPRGHPPPEDCERPPRRAQRGRDPPPPPGVRGGALSLCRASFWLGSDVPGACGEGGRRRLASQSVSVGPARPRRCCCSCCRCCCVCASGLTGMPPPRLLRPSPAAASSAGLPVHGCARGGVPRGVDPRRRHHEARPQGEAAPPAAGPAPAWFWRAACGLWGHDVACSSCVGRCQRLPGLAYPLDPRLLQGSLEYFSRQ